MYEITGFTGVLGSRTLQKNKDIKHTRFNVCYMFTSSVLVGSSGSVHVRTATAACSRANLIREQHDELCNLPV